MITIISASKRVGNLSSLFAKYCENYLTERKEEVKLFELDSLPDQIDLHSVYEYKTSVFSKIAEEYIIPANKFLFIVPEYNGSIPGILKLFLDAIEPVNYRGKKAALIGISAGRAGNLRGMDHLSDILNYLQVAVMPQKLPISKIYDLLSKNELNDDYTRKEMEKQMELLLSF